MLLGRRNRPLQVVGDGKELAHDIRNGGLPRLGCAPLGAAPGILGIGQSSWGPTGFALLDSAARAEAVAKAAGDRFGARHHLDFRIVGGRNRGADITVLASE